ncbi:MAG: murein biosynthesis integral membrane protein MurJ [Actinobacteria bacterium]|nr:murein biosynthesis integral membrane protein MurJ [Actinomycetota bacterium]MSW10729.1 murein biosynthesis integral membrane protein MurJ [Actinomycetota bacterium]MSY16430.1 murein biosynthesis integral membrane protein MurJ [Actinomycetota bacterium]MSY40604.1 murein biosynthesis integral membrane protein MurJ [Actinomycetota bacterium]MSY97518.1 murein biosynthesis integral membrane protein MurJ [Actinomycetota bacterium]
MTENASGRSLAQSSAVMASGTIVSRITGVLRDVAAAAALGFYLVSDAFSLGNSLPTIVYILIIGGALNAVFIPQLVRRMSEDEDQGKAYADRLITLIVTVLLLLSILAVLAAPLIVDLYTPADYPTNEFDLAVAFARLCLPQVLFYGIYSILGQVLNARGRFGAPMFAPIANNVIAIATFLLFIAVAGTSAAADGILTTQQILILGIGTTLGVISQAVILFPVLRRAGFHWRPRFDWKGAGLGKAGGLAMWTIGLVLVNQATYVVITRLATQANVDAAAAGTVAAGLTTYQKAHLVFMLPHSVITISIVTAMLPALSRLAHAGDLRQVGSDIGTTMRTVAALIVPIAAVLFVTGSDLSILLFGYGAATPEQASLMGEIVSMFMIGLLPFTLFYVLLRGYYAMEDTRTPFYITVGLSAFWLITVVPLFGIAPAGGAQVAVIALTYSLSYWVGLALAWVLLARRVGGVNSGRTIRSILRIGSAGLVSLGLMLGTHAILGRTFSAQLPGDKLVVLLILVVVGAVGVASYWAAAWALRVKEVAAVTNLVRRRLRTP